MSHPLTTSQSQEVSSDMNHRRAWGRPRGRGLGWRGRDAKARFWESGAAQAWERAAMGETRATPSSRVASPAFQVRPRAWDAQAGQEPVNYGSNESLSAHPVSSLLLGP